MSMGVIYDRAPGRHPDPITLVMLPGAKARPQDLLDHGFVRALRERCLAIDVVAVDAHLGYYLDGSFSAHLREDVIAPALAGNCRRIWLLGISLGGMGALTYAHEHPAEIEGVVLLAPFLGLRGTIAEIAGAGGLAHWQPGTLHADDNERRLLAWVKTFEPAAAALRRIYLGYGTADRFAVASQLLAARLPVTQVTTTAGGHDWPTWLGLWQQLLDRDLFAGPARQHAPIEKNQARTQGRRA
jgi:pimeloyl-ACP methyl ester carboxylesterase